MYEWGSAEKPICPDADTYDYNAPLAAADNVADFCLHFDPYSYDQYILYYLTKDKQLFGVKENKSQLLLENVAALSTRGTCAVTEDGRVWRYRLTTGSPEDILPETINTLDIQIDPNEIKKCTLDINGCGMILSNDGKLWKIESHDLTVYTYTKIADNVRDWYFSTPDGLQFILTNDDCLMMGKTDKNNYYSDNTLSFEQWTEVMTDVRKMDNVIDPITLRSMMTVLKNDNSLWVLGRNDYFKLGSNNHITTDVFTPVEYNVKDHYCDVAGTSFILKNDDTLWAKGLILPQWNISKEVYEKEGKIESGDYVDNYYQINDNVKSFYAELGEPSSVFMIKNDNSLEIMGMCINENVKIPVKCIDDISHIPLKFSTRPFISAGVQEKKETYLEWYRQINGITDNPTENVNSNPQSHNPNDNSLLYIYLFAVIGIFIVIFIFAFICVHR